MSNWISVKTKLPENFKPVLTMHEEDLYPVCAFRTGDSWVREVEGPEDIFEPYSGKGGVLYRPPTHWMEIPPLEEGD